MRSWIRRCEGRERSLRGCLSPLEIATGLIRGGPFITEIQERGGDADAVIGATAGKLTSEFGSGPIVTRLSAFVCSALA
jgi:hypothetical protein